MLSFPVRVALALTLLLVVVGPALAAQRGADELEAEMRGIARDLQCPVCEGLSVADSPSQLAGQMRAIIREKLVAGESRDQIVRFFQDRYGENVLMAPAQGGPAALIWLAPYLAVAVALVVVFSVVHKKARPPGAPDGEERLEPYLVEVDRRLEQTRDEPLR